MNLYDNRQRGGHQRSLILTLDYEIFGNGSGDVRQHIVEPAARIARICERYRYPLTIFFEAEEYLAFERYSNDLKRSLGYDPADVIRKQVTSLVRSGHQFQLHLHPQWYGARFQNDRWLLRPEMETVDQLFETVEEVCAYIAERKILLEGLMGEAGNRVIAYRAGAFCARPGDKLLNALNQNGILFDSSVVRGLYNEGPGYTLDYRRASNLKRMWRVQTDVIHEDPQGVVWEVPIHSVTGRRYKQLTPDRLRAKFSGNVPTRQRSDMLKRFVDPQRSAGLMKLLFERVPIKLDYHNMNGSALYQTIKAADWNPTLGPDVLVAIGHTKEHVNDRPLSELLRLISEDSQLEMGSFDSVAEALRAPNPTPPREPVPSSEA